MAKWEYVLNMSIFSDLNSTKCFRFQFHKGKHRKQISALNSFIFLNCVWIIFSVHLKHLRFNFFGELTIKGQYHQESVMIRSWDQLIVLSFSCFIFPVMQNLIPLVFAFLIYEIIYFKCSPCKHVQCYHTSSFSA